MGVAPYVWQVAAGVVVAIVAAYVGAWIARSYARKAQLAEVIATLSRIGGKLDEAIERLGDHLKAGGHEETKLAIARLEERFTGIHDDIDNLGALVRGLLRRRGEDPDEQV